MSSGTPPDSGRVSRFTLDDAVAELKDLVDLSKQHLRLTDQLLAAFKGGARPGGPGASGGGGGSHGLHGLFEKLLGQKTKGPSIGRGVGAWLKHKIRGPGSRARRWKVTAYKVARGAGKSLGLKSGTGISIARAAAGLAGLAGAAVTVAGAFATVAAAGIAAYEAVDHFTNSAMETAKRLSAVSGGMSAVIAQREIGQIMRDVRRGQATAGRAQELMSAESRRKDQENRIEIVLDNAKNSVLAVLNDMLTGVFKPAADVLEEIAAFFGASKPVEASGVAGMEGDVMAAVRRYDADARRLMEVAARRAAADAGGGFAGRPPGALP